MRINLQEQTSRLTGIPPSPVLEAGGVFSNMVLLQILRGKNQCRFWSLLESSDEWLRGMFLMANNEVFVRCFFGSCEDH